MDEYLKTLLEQIRWGRGFLEKKVEEWKEYSAAVTNVLVMEV